MVAMGDLLGLVVTAVRRHLLSVLLIGREKGRPAVAACGADRFADPSVRPFENVDRTVALAGRRIATRRAGGLLVLQTGPGTVAGVRIIAIRVRWITAACARGLDVGLTTISSEPIDEKTCMRFFDRVNNTLSRRQP